MPNLTKRFGAFDVELTPCEDRDSVYVDVTHRETGVSNSLGLLQDMGEFDELPRDSDQPILIPQHTLDEIEAWALQNGY